MQATKKQQNATTTRIISILYLIAIAFIITQDIPRGTINTLNTIAITYVVLFNIAFTVNIVRLLIKQATFTIFSALYISALVGFFMSLAAYDMARSTGASISAPGAVFSLSLLYIAVYTVVLAGHGAWTGRI